MKATGIAAIRLLCPDPTGTAAFYAAAFGCATKPDGAGGMVVAFGRQNVQLARTQAPRGEPARSNWTSFQHCALVVSDMDTAYARLRSVPGWSAISTDGPEHLPASSGGVSAFKFRDPDGHPLEFLFFPAGSGPASWRAAAGLFLGIDHTAITVTDTEHSVRFYAELGFTVASRGVNEGDEQARMDAVAAPRVEVTGLSLPGDPKPHLELLCYRSPRTVTVPTDDGAITATRIVLSGERPGTLVDPDGHRLVTDTPAAS